MTKFVWVLGPTAVGKETLIHSIATDPQHPLISKLGLEAPFLEQRDALFLRHEEREYLDLKLLADREKAKTVLIKWQGHDQASRAIQKLKARTPNDEFIYLFLDAQPVVIRRRRLQ